MGQIQSHMRYEPQYHTACQIQRLILRKMGLDMQQRNRVPKPGDPALSEKLKPSELCSLATAWEKIEDRKRILRMKGLPKPVDPVSKDKAKARPAHW